MEYESTILKRLINTYGVVGNPRYISEIIKEFIVQGKECFPNLFTYQADWLAHIDEFGLNPTYTVTYTGQSIYAPNTLERPVKSAILKGKTGYRDKDTGEILDVFEEGRNLELVSVRVPVLTTYNTLNLVEVSELSGGASANPSILEITKIDKGYNVTSNGRGAVWVCLGYSFNDIFSNNDIGKTFRFKAKVTQKADNSNGGEIFAYMNGSLDGAKNNNTNNGDVIAIDETFTVKRSNSLTIYITRNRNLPINVDITDIELFESGFDSIKSNILTVNEDVVLRGIGEVKDTLDCLTGEVVERVGYADINNFVAPPSYRTLSDNQGYMAVIELENKKQSTNLVSNLVNVGSINEVDFGMYNNPANIVIFRKNCTLDELQSIINQIQIIYELETESVKTVELTTLDQNGQNVEQLMTFNGGTHFTTSSQGGSLLPMIRVDVVTDLEETLKVCSLEGNTL